MKYVNFHHIPEHIEFPSGRYVPLKKIMDDVKQILDSYPNDFLVATASCPYSGDITIFISKGETQEDIDKRHEEEDKKERYEQYLVLKKEFENDIS